MKRVLFVGQEPETVDFSDPALPPGFDAEKIRGGVAAGMKQCRSVGGRPISAWFVQTNPRALPLSAILQPRSMIAL